MDDLFIDGYTFTKKKQVHVDASFCKDLLEKTCNQVYNYPTAFLTMDLFTDSGCAALTQQTTMALALGDEAHTRGNWYYALLDSMRDLVERGDNPKKAYKCLFDTPIDPKALVNDLIVPDIPKDSFIGDQKEQMQNPNAFITPQGRSAESLIWRAIHKVNKDQNTEQRCIALGNGIFTTTKNSGSNYDFKCEDIPQSNTIQDISKINIDEIGKENPLNGGINLEKLATKLEEYGDKVAMVIMTLTNNNLNAQPVSIENLKSTYEITRKFGIPVLLDACRVHENAYLNKLYNPSCKDLSISEILKQTFTYCDGFFLSFKKFIGSIGGFCAIRRDGLFLQRYKDLCHQMKWLQIWEVGNESYGGMSGRDMAAATIAIYESTDESYLKSRYSQIVYLGKKLAQAGVPIQLPLGGHSITFNADDLFPGRKWDEYIGMGFSYKMIEKFGIRIKEVGYFYKYVDRYFEKHGKLPEGVKNNVKITLPAQVYGKEHLDYLVNAVQYFVNHPKEIPAMEIVCGKDDINRYYVAQFKPKESLVE